MSIATGLTMKSRFVVSGLELDRTLQFQADLQEKIQNLTTDEIRAALREVFANATMVELMAGDMARANEETPEGETPTEKAAAKVSGLDLPQRQNDGGTR